MLDHIPIIGLLISPVATTVIISIMAVRGHRLDNKNGDIITMTQELIKFIRNIKVNINEQFKSNDTEKYYDIQPYK